MSALDATIHTALAILLATLVVFGMYVWFRVSWEVSNGAPWGLSIFLSPVVIVLWFSFYLGF